MDCPKVADYKNVREFLKDWFVYAKATDPSFSYRNFALRAGLKSHSQIHKVLNGKAEIRNDELSLYTKGLGLKYADAVHFQRIAVQEKKNTRVIEEDLSGTIIAKIILSGLLQLQDFRPDPQWIHEMSRKTISFADAKSAIEDLKKDGSLKQDDKGNWVMSSLAITPPKDTILNHRPLYQFTDMLHQADNVGKGMGALFTINCTRDEAQHLFDTLQAEILKFNQHNKSDREAFALHLSCNQINPTIQ